MVIRGIFILSLITTQALSAPSLCKEACNSYVSQQYTQSSSNFQDHGLSQVASRLQSPEYSKPGTWREHNDYNVDNGHGKVHEERGQVVDGPKTVRYYKKNYSSSYSSRHPSDSGLLNVEQQRQGVYLPSADATFDSQRAYSQVDNSRLTAQQRGYSTVQNEQRSQSSFRKSERLEDLGEYTGSSQVAQHGASNLDSQYAQRSHGTNEEPGNWSTVDSYRTDGGRGRVHTEEGQLVTGGKKVRYYKKNYTSSYSSSDAVPHADVASIDVQREIEKLHREFGKELGQVSTVDTVGSSNIHSGLHSVNSNDYRRDRNSYGSTSYGTHRAEDQQISDITSGHLSSQIPSQNAYGTSSYSAYEKHEGRTTKLQPASQIINPTSGYTNVLNAGNSYNSGYNRNLYSGTSSQQHTEDFLQQEKSDAHQTNLAENQMFHDNSRSSVYRQNNAIRPSLSGQTQYKEHWSSSQIKEASAIPYYPTGVNQHSAQQYNNYGNTHQATHGSYAHHQSENGYASSQKTQLGKLVTGTLDLGLGHDTVDCEHDLHQSHSSYQHQTRYKRDANYNRNPWNTDEPLTDLEIYKRLQKRLQEITQQTFGDQESQQSHHSWEPYNKNQKKEDFTQETDQFDDLTQQTSGKLEFGQESQQTYQPWKPQSANQKVEDLTQQTDQFDDLTQQTSGKLEFGQETQQTYQPWKPQSSNQKVEDITQQTDQFGDVTQQTSGNLEFGQDSQQSYQPWKPQSANQKEEDLTQQTSGNFELGQESQQSFQPWKPQSANQKVEDLTQQTDQFDDLTQQTSGKLEFGQESQQSYQPWKPQSASQKTEDLTQQTSGKLEFGQESQQSNQPWKPQSTSQKVEDLTQQTDDLNDVTQQTSGKLEFGQESQQSYQPSKPQSSNQEVEDLSQQTSGKIEFGHESQQTNQFDDFTQQTSGNLEFGQESQQTYQPKKPQSDNQKVEDLTQQTDQFDDLTQQTSGKLEFGQETQQTYQPWKPQSSSQKVEDITQQTDQFGDLTQQTSGNLEFGQESQQSYQPWKPQSANQKLEDLAQQTDKFGDLTQQTSGNLEFGQDSQQSYQPWKPQSANQKLDDLAQQTDQFGDLTQQTSGNLEFGQESQQTYQPWNPNPTQTTGGVSTQGPSQFPKPIEKPKPRPRYSRPLSTVQVENQHTNDITNQENNVNLGNLEVIDTPVEVNTHSNINNIRGDQNVQGISKDSKDTGTKYVNGVEQIEDGNVDQVHKTNDATVGLQWHYTYHPSDQRQFVQQTNQKEEKDFQQQSTKLTEQQNLDEESQNKYAGGLYRPSQNYAPEPGVKSTRRKYSPVQQESKPKFNEKTSEKEGKESIEPKIESKILEAYGGGQYDPHHSDDIFTGVTINPSATLQPLINEDAWYIREKPEEESTPPAPPVEPLDFTFPETTTDPPSFWSKFGHKITDTFDKAKEKARGIFG